MDKASGQRRFSEAVKIKLRPEIRGRTSQCEEFRGKLFKVGGIVTTNAHGGKELDGL